MKANIVIEYDDNKEIYFSSENISDVKDKFEYVRQELKNLGSYFVRNLSTIIETYDQNSNSIRLYYINLTR